VACLLAAAVVLLLASPAHAQDEDPAVIDKVTKMNKKAVEEYENLNFEEARKILKDALDVCSQNGLDKHPIKARTHVHLGVVILAGFKQRELAIKQFRKALEIQPDIKLTKSLANPEIQEAFDEAEAGMGKSEPPEKPEGEKPPTEKPPENPPEETPTEPFSHKPVTRATQGRPIPILVQVDPSLNAKRVVLAYRAGETGDFLGRDMKETSPGKWSAEIPASATGGNRLSYYVDAQKEDGDSVGSKGSAEDPLVVTLKGAGAPEPKEKGEDEEEGEVHWFVGLGFGSGFGWATGAGEVNVSHMINPAGLAPSQLGHVLPEVGYFVTPKLLVSAQLRFQYITGPTPEPGPASDCGSDLICSPAKSAVAFFGKASWLFGEGNFHPYAAGLLGGGYVRHVAAFPSAGKNCGTTPAAMEPCVDTVVAGPVFVGGGAGFYYNLSQMFALSLGLNTYAGFPKFTFQFDFNGGVALEF
jgi:hypothetical protein